MNSLQTTLRPAQRGHFSTPAALALAAALALGAGAAQAVPVGPPQVVHFNNSDGLQLTGYLYHPNSILVRSTAVVMLHGCKGVFDADGNINNIYIEWAARLNKAGHIALLVDSFTPRSTSDECGNGPGTGVSEIFDRPKDAVAAADYLSTQVMPANRARIGLLGWSHGASTVMATLATTDPINYTTATSLATPFKVGVAFYPGGKLADANHCGTYTTSSGTQAPKGCWKSWNNSQWDSYAPLNVYHGTKDQTTPHGDAKQRIDLAQQSAGGAAVAQILYTDAEHSFDDPDIGGGACLGTSTPNTCAKLSADPAALSFLSQYLK